MLVFYCIMVILYNHRCEANQQGLLSTRSVCSHHLEAQTMAAYPSLPLSSLVAHRNTVYFSSLCNDAGTKIPAPVIPPS